MTADLTQECADLAAWYTHAATLTSKPDIQPAAGRTQPASRPPWNSQAAYAVLDIHAAARAIEQDLRYEITGRITGRGGSDANTIAALGQIPRLAEAATATLTGETTRLLERLITAVLVLPAIDLEQRPQRLSAPCPRPGCRRPMLRYYPSRRELACLGCMVKAEVWDGPVSGEAVLKWEDGLVT